MKSCIYKQSLGGGYGINRGLGGEKHLSTAIPPHSNPTRNDPGRGSASEQGKSGKRHFQGVMIEKRTAK
jgi:hypothetical protein